MKKILLGLVVLLIPNFAWACSMAYHPYIWHAYKNIFFPLQLNLSTLSFLLGFILTIFFLYQLFLSPSKVFPHTKRNIILIVIGVFYIFSLHILGNIFENKAHIISEQIRQEMTQECKDKFEEDTQEYYRCTRGDDGLCFYPIGDAIEKDTKKFTNINYSDIWNRLLWCLIALFIIRWSSFLVRNIVIKIIFNIISILLLMSIVMTLLGFFEIFFIFLIPIILMYILLISVKRVQPKNIFQYFLIFSIILATLGFLIYLFSLL